MKEQYRKHNIFLLFLFLSILLWITGVLIKAYRAKGYQILASRGEYFECSEGWYDDTGKVYNIEKYVFTKADVQQEKIFHYDIPDDITLENDESLCFFSRGMDFDVYVEEPSGRQKIFSYKQNAAHLSGRDIGFTVHVVPLDQAYEHRKITISIVPAEYSAYILGARIEKPADFMLEAIRPRVGRLIGSIFILFFGIAIIIYTIFDVETKREFKTVLYSWGSFSTILGIVLMIQSLVIQIFTGLPEFWSTLKYAVILLICYPLSVQGDSITKAPHKHFSKIIGYVVLGLMLLETAGCFLLDMSFYRLWYLSAIIMGVNFVCTVICLIKEIKYTGEHNESKLSVLFLSMLVVLQSVVVVDLGIYLKEKKHMTDWGRFIRICYILIAIVMLVILLKESIKRNHQARLAKALQEKNALIETDLATAKKIQLDAIPVEYPAFPDHKGVNLVAHMKTAKEVGGDFYDYFAVDEKRVCFVIADVSGKGIPAALCMMTIKTIIEDYAMTSADTAEIFSLANRMFCEHNRSGLFATAWIGMLDTETMKLQYTNAGHCKPLYAAAGKPYEELKKRHGLFIGGMDDTSYQLSELQLNPGDRLFIYTDGLTEAHNVNNELYGRERLIASLETLDKDLKPESLLKIISDIDEFAGEEPQFDDMTMLMVEITS